MVEDFPSILEQTLSKSGLGGEATADIFRAMANGELAAAQQAALLIALKARGETAEQLAAAAQTMAEFMRPVANSSHSIDTCGTGGDGVGSYNISTAAALITAATGMAVAKHGNRAQSSKCGSADVLEALGVATDSDPVTAAADLKRHNFCFMAAPLYHPAMGNVAAVRQSLRVRTIFNLIGPMMNPAGAKFRLLGVFGEEVMEPIALGLRALGVKRAWVLHGIVDGRGIDELTLGGATKVIELKDGKLTKPFVIEPKQLGLATAPLAEIKGGDAETNASALKRVLENRPSAYATTCLLNAAAALVVAEHSESLAQGLDEARKTLADGAAATLLDELVAAKKLATADAATPKIPK